MQIKILFDSVPVDNRFLGGWGVSYLIDDKVLFDTGGKPNSLLKNMQNMSVLVSDIKAIVISHEHWDHTGGLWGLLKENSNLSIYACPHFGKKFKNRVKSYPCQLIEVDRFTRVLDNIYTTGEIEGRYGLKFIPEQALVLDTTKGITIITGCAHPGIIKIIDDVKQNFPSHIYLLLGGFHLMGKDKKSIKPIVDKFREFKISKLAPSHCTGKNATELFEREYGSDSIEVRVGEIIQI